MYVHYMSVDAMYGYVHLLSATLTERARSREKSSWAAVAAAAGAAYICTLLVDFCENLRFPQNYTKSEYPF